MVIKKISYILDNEFELSFEPIEETIIIKKTKEGGFEIKYLIPDIDYSLDDLNMDREALVVNYHRDFYIDKPDIITESEVRAWYQGKKIKQLKDYYIYPLACLVHSGIWLKVGFGGFVGDSGGWDTSHVGVVLVSKRLARTREEARKIAFELVNNYNKVLQGDVYCLTKELYNQDKKHLKHEIIGGYIGYEKALEELKVF